MTAAEENLFRRLLSLCDAQDRLTPAIHAEDVRAFEALTDQLHYLRLANVKGTYALTPAGAAARRTLIMLDEQRAREDALRAQVEAFRQQLLQTQRQTADAMSRAMQELSEYKDKQKKAARRNAWHWWITTAISVASLLLSIADRFIF